MKIECNQRSVERAVCINPRLDFKSMQCYYREIH